MTVDWAARDRRLVAVWIAVVAGTLVVLAGPVARPAHACICSQATETERFARSDVVFVGEVVGYEPPPSEGEKFHSTGDPATWTFAVRDVYKGAVTEFQPVASPVDPGTCGLSLADHATFLVFADGAPFAPPYGLVPHPENTLYAESCGGTRPMTAGPLAVEGVHSSMPLPGGVDPARVEAEDSGDRGAVALVTVGGIGVVALAALGIALRARRRRQA